MKLWRLEKEKYTVASLEGIGAARQPGRWNRPRQRVVYCAEHPALALLEILVHNEVDWEDLPPYKLLEIHAPGRSMAKIKEVPTSRQECIRLGGEWLESRRSLLLSVPSVIVPRARNILINPEHKFARSANVQNVHDFNFDFRLF